MATKKPPFNPNAPFETGGVDVLSQKPAFNPNQSFQPAASPIDVLSEGFIKQQQFEDVQQELAKQVNSLSNTNDDEKEWLKKTSYQIGQKLPNGEEFTIDKWNEAKKVLNKESEEFGESIFGGPSRTAYYWDQDGMPKPLKYGERPPVNTKVASAFGNSVSSDDDTWATNLSKNVWNGFIDILNVPANLYDVGQLAVTGTESQLANTMRNTVDRLKFDTRQDKGLVSEDAFKSTADFFNSENWNFNDPYAVTSALGQGVGSLAQYLVGTGIVNRFSKGLGTTAKGEEVASKATQWINTNKNAITAGTMVSMNEALNVADRIGLEGREKAAFATTTALGVGMLEFLGSMETGAMKALGLQAKRKLSEEAAKSFIQSGAEVSAKGLKEAFDATLQAGARKMPEWIKQGALEATEEVAQTYYTAASADAYRKLGGQTDFKSDLTSSQTMKDALEGAFVGGALGTISGAFMNNRNEEQLDNIYQYIKADKKTELLQELHNLREVNGISEVDYEAAKDKIGMYEGYIKQFQGKGLNDIEEKQAVDVLNKADNLEARIKEIENDNTISKTNKEAQLGAYEQERKKYVKQLQEVYSGEYFKAKEKELEKEAEDNVKEAQENISKVRDLAEKIASGDREFTSEELQLQQNFPKELEVELDIIKAGQPEEVVFNPEEIESQKIPIKSKEVKDLGDFISNRMTGRRRLTPSEKADTLKDFLENRKSKKIGGGTIELPPYGATSKYGVHYNVKFGNQIFKMASRFHTKYHKKKQLVDIPVEVKLIKPIDEALGSLEKDVVLGKEGQPVFKFKNSEYPDTEYSYILQVRDERTGDVISNLRTSDFGAGKKVRAAEKKERPSVKKPKSKIGEYDVDLIEGELSVTKEGKEVNGDEKSKAIKGYEEEFSYDSGENIENIPDNLEPDQVYEYVAENSKNPLEVIRNYESALIDQKGDEEPEYVSKLKGRFKVLTGMDLTERVSGIALENELVQKDIEFADFTNQNFTNYEEATKSYEEQLRQEAALNESEDDGTTERGGEDRGKSGAGSQEGQEPVIQKQKKGEGKKESLEESSKKIEVLKKSLPGIEVVIDPDIDGAGQLDADGKTVRINPNYNTADTSIHEFGHALIDMIGYDSEIIQDGVSELRGTELWNETIDKYPELNDEMVAKEVLATAIGREGVKIFDNETKQNAFVKWVNKFFDAIKDLLGIDKNTAKKLARMLLSGKEIKGDLKAAGIIQRQKLDKVVEKEIKSLKDSKPQSFAQYVKSQGTSLKEINTNIEKLKKDIEASGNKEDIQALEENIDALNESIEYYKEAHEAYLKDRKKIIDIVESKGDVSKMSENDLVEINALLSKYADIRKTQSYKDILFNIGAKLHAEQVKKLEANPNYDPSKEQSGDLNKSDVWSQSISTIDQRFPAIQAFYKRYRKAFSDMNTEFNRIRKDGDKLAQAVIKDYNKTHSVSDRAKNFVIGGGNKYFSYLAKDGKLIEKGSPEYNELSKPQKDLLDFITKEKNKLAEHTGIDNDVLLKSGAGFIETFGKSGLFKAYANWITRNYQLRDIKVDFKDPKTGVKSYQFFGDVENLLSDYADQGIVSKVHALALITKYNLQARNLLNKKVHADPNEKFDVKGAGGRYYLAPDGRLVSMFGGEFKGDFTDNYYETFMRFAKDSTFSKHMSPLMPYLNGLETFYGSFGRNKENVVKFLDVVKRGKFQGETIESGLGATADAVLSILRKWTSWRFMAFNYPANLFNIAVGEYNQWRADGGKSYKKGKLRMGGSIVKAKGLENAKALNILRKYVPDILEDVDNVDPQKHLGHYVEMFSFGGLKFGEAFIRGSAIIGKISNEHYNWFDSKGNIKGAPEEVAERERIMKEEMLEYESQVDAIQGRYSELNRRNFAYFELGQFFGQFKTWMPEWLSDRFAGQYIDADGNTRRGSFNTLLTYGLKDFSRDIFKKEFYTSDETKYANARKQLRGMIIVSVLYLAYLDASDDDQDKELAYDLDKALRNISSIYRMDNNTFLVSQPAAGASAVLDLTKALQAAVSMQEYKKSGKRGEKGDLKAPDMFFDLVPGNVLVKQGQDLLEDE